VREARASLEEERSRLAALMADLSQSVVVCNLDGRVLLYNQRAKQELSAGPTAAMPNCSALDVRSTPSFDRALIGHALERLQQASRSGPRETARSSSARRSSSPPRVPGVCCARTCRRSWVGTARTMPQVGGLSITGFVLVLEDVTSTNERHARRDALIQSLIEGGRGPLGSIRAAAEMLSDFSDMPSQQRDRFPARHPRRGDRTVARSSRRRPAPSRMICASAGCWRKSCGGELLLVAARRIAERARASGARWPSRPSTSKRTCGCAWTPSDCCRPALSGPAPAGRV
jgi:DNA polymerase-3 subunit epsilon